jgi:hypothetical protein
LGGWREGRREVSRLATYHDIIERKRVAFQGDGLSNIPALNPAMFDHQRHATEFALRKGRAALFLDTGLGKSLCALDWGRIIVEHTNKPVLMLAPLAVAQQHAREAEKFGIEAQVVRSGEEVGAKRIYITNYDQLDKFDADRFAGIILDESSVIKNFTGKTTRKLIDTFAQTQFRLACTATPAPNDHTELGNHSEFLGAMRREEMLPIWFINDTMDTGTWRIKGHARENFWSWVASWSRCVSKPSDLGFSDDGFILPPLKITHHEIEADRSIDRGEEKKGKLQGQHRLFRIPDTSATSIHTEKRMTIASRAKLVAEIVFGDRVCPGSLNTPQNVESVIRQAKQSERGGNLKGDHQPKTSPTCETIIPPTKTNTSGALKNKKSEISDDANGTPKTTPTEKNASDLQKTPVLRSEGKECFSENMELMLPSTSDCSPLSNSNAPYAKPTTVMPSNDASQLITVTKPEGLGDCSAPIATKVSENSKTAFTYSNGPFDTSDGRDWWVVWCDTDYEQDALEKNFGDAAISIRGPMPSHQKEYLHEAWLRGDRKILICKPVMFGYGLNWQHCCKMIFCGISFSYENFYQAIRRSWRFGQLRPVQIHVVCADTERAIWAVVERKSGDHEAMKREMVAAMRRSVANETSRKIYSPTKGGALPAWL